jgi:hypothetical protein
MVWWAADMSRYPHSCAVPILLLRSAPSRPRGTRPTPRAAFARDVDAVAEGATALLERATDGAARPFKRGVDQLVSEFREGRWRVVRGVCGVVHSRRMLTPAHGAPRVLDLDPASEVSSPQDDSPDQRCH